MHAPDLLIILLLAAGATASAYWKKLTPAAALTGGLIGWAVYKGDGYRGLIELALFFILGTAATAWKKKEKLAIRGNAAHQSTRTTGQVIANGGVAAIIGILIILFPTHNASLSIALAASLSAATGDTLSSELGLVYGRHCYNILTWKKETRGPDGVISLEGLLLGTVGSVFIAVAYALPGVQNNAQNAPHSSLSTAMQNALQMPPPTAPLLIILAGLIGNLTDSILGASLERRKWLSNDQVNFGCTLIAAACTLLFTGFHS